MNYNQKLLKAIEAWENLGNSVEEFGEIIADLTSPDRNLQRAAKRKIKNLPYSDEIILQESRS